jgi:hypothetical protein
LIYLVAAETGQLVPLAAPPNPSKPLTGIVAIRFSEEGLLLEDCTRTPVHVKDKHLDPAALEAFLHELSFDVRFGWQPSADLSRRKPRR